MKYEGYMIWVIIGVLFLLWLLAVVFKFLVSGLIHILLIAAAGLLIYRLFKGRTADNP